MNEKDILNENKRIYADLIKVREKIKDLSTRLDLEIALQGSNALHHGSFSVDNGAKLFVDLVILRCREYRLNEQWNDNLNELKEMRRNNHVAQV